MPEGDLGVLGVQGRGRPRWVLLGRGQSWCGRRWMAMDGSSSNVSLTTNSSVAIRRFRFFQSFWGQERVTLAERPLGGGAELNREVPQPRKPPLPTGSSGVPVMDVWVLRLCGQLKREYAFVFITLGFPKLSRESMFSRQFHCSSPLPSDHEAFGNYLTVSLTLSF